jgi:hypothetical protein
MSAQITPVIYLADTLKHPQLLGTAFTFLLMMTPKFILAMSTWIQAKSKGFIVLLATAGTETTSKLMAAETLIGSTSHRTNTTT